MDQAITLRRLVDHAVKRAGALTTGRVDLERAAADVTVRAGWPECLTGQPNLSVIAEVKRRSPSVGDIAPDVDPAGHARAYAAGGAAAVSVLTDDIHFGGSLDDLRLVAAAVDVPVLRKDFIVDPLQLLEARAAGASAVLLIVRALSTRTLAALMRESEALGLGTLVEVHHPGELDIALGTGAAVVGVNARDLDTFNVDLDSMETVLGAIPSGVVAIAESGIGSTGDVERVAAWGADGILVGTSVVKAPDPAEAVRRLCGTARRGRAKGAG